MKTYEYFVTGKIDKREKQLILSAQWFMDNAGLKVVDAFIFAPVSTGRCLEATLLLDKIVYFYGREILDSNSSIALLFFLEVFS